jgi:hypothetical protein
MTKTNGIKVTSITCFSVTINAKKQNDQQKFQVT